MDKASPMQFKRVLYEKLFSQLVETRKAKKNMWDDLKLWSLEIAKTFFQRGNFSASGFWISKFKKFYQIKFVSCSYTKDEEELWKLSTWLFRENEEFTWMLLFWYWQYSPKQLREGNENKMHFVVYWWKIYRNNSQSVLSSTLTL